MRHLLVLLLALAVLPGLRPVDDDADLEILIMRLGDKSATWRAKAARGIAELGPKGRFATPNLVERLEEDEDAEVRAAAAGALGAIGVSARKDGQDALAEAVAKDDDPLVRLTSATALVAVEADDRGALAALAKALRKDDDHRVRTNAARALAELAGSDKATVGTLTKALGDNHWSVRAMAATALGDAGEAGGPASKTLLRLLGDDSEAVRAMAARGLGLVPGDTKRTPAALLKALEAERSRLAEGESDDAKSGPEDAVLRRLLAETGGARRNIAWALGRQKAGGRDVERALKALQDDDPVKVVQQAAKTALERRDPTQLPGAQEEEHHAFRKVPELPWSLEVRGALVLRLRFDEKSRVASD